MTLVLGTALFALLYMYLWRSIDTPNLVGVVIHTQQMEAEEQMQALLAHLRAPQPQRARLKGV